MKFTFDWTFFAPVAALVILGVAVVVPNGWILGLGAIALAFAVFAAVHHAEVVAHRVGEPFGTLVLAVAVTVIEVALIVSIMLSGGAEKATLPRDTVFAAVMIVCTGILGLCLLAGGWRHHEQSFQLQGVNATMSVLCALSVLTMVLPNFTSTVVGPGLSSSQLVFVGVTSLVLYLVFVFVQTMRHREYFLPPTAVLQPGQLEDDVHAPLPTNGYAMAAGGLLLLSLIAVVGLAKLLSPAVEAGVAAAGAPASVVGVVIAALVLLPEGVAALRAARANRLQTSMNLALGSALASIGLTIPAVAVVSLAIGQPILLGLAPKEIVLLALTLLVSVITLATGRSTVLQGMVHLVIFATFLFLSIVP